MKVRVVKRIDGGVSVIHPAPKSWRKKDIIKIVKEKENGKEINKTVIVAKAETEEEWLNRVFSDAMNKDHADENRNPIPNPLKGLPYKDVDESEIPSDREFRDAWEFDNITKKIKVNPHKKDKIIKERNIAKKKEEILERQAKEELGIND